MSVGQTVVIDVLANDHDPDGDPLAVQWATALAGLTNNQDGTFTYVAPATLVATFTYSVTDGTVSRPGEVRIVPPIELKDLDLPPAAGFVYECQPTATAVARCTFDAGASQDDRGIVSYDWAFGGTGAPAGATGLTVSMLERDFPGGSFSATLTVRDTDNQSDALTRTVVIDVPPVARLSATCNGGFCAFSAQSSDDGEGGGTGGLDFAWVLGDGTSRGDVVGFGHGYPALGLPYRLRLTVNEPSRGQTAVLRHDLVIPDFETHCADLACAFHASPPAGFFGVPIPYTWDLRDGFGGSGKLAQRSYSAAGLSPATLRVTEGGAATVNSFLERQILVSDIGADCTDGVCQMTALPDSAGGLAATYEWDFDQAGSVASFAAAPVHEYGGAGSFRPRLAVRVGSEQSHERTVDLVLPSFTFECLDLDCTFQGSPTMAEAPVPLTYEWDFDGDGAVDATGEAPAHAYDEEGPMLASLTVKDPAELRVARATEEIDVFDETMFLIMVLLDE